MNAATAPRSRGARRLLLVDPCGASFRETRLADLPDLFRAGDLLVVNGAATIPASFRARLDAHEVELRLAAANADGGFDAVLFGTGDWRQRTEDRPAPPPAPAGSLLELDGGLAARVVAISPISPRLVTLRFVREGAELWSALHRAGRPIQYSYLSREVGLAEVQTLYAARPFAFEPPSAGLPLDAELLLALRRRGVEVAALTHAAGLSATGDPALDAALPLAERYEIPEETAHAVPRARRNGGRVIAVGTTVVRALESAWRDGAVVPGAGVTELKIGPAHRLRAVDGLVTGLHERDASHFTLVEAFASAEVVDAAWAYAEREGFLGHEFGDVALLRCA